MILLITDYPFDSQQNRGFQGEFRAPENSNIRILRGETSDSCDQQGFSGILGDFLEVRFS